MHIIQNGIRIEIDHRHNVRVINGKKMVLCHDDSCDCPLINGNCPICGFAPDMQSKQFWSIEQEPNILDLMLDNNAQ